MFAAKYQLKRVTVAIRNYASFHSMLRYEQIEKGKPINKHTVFLIKSFAVSIVTTRVRMPSISTDTASQSFCHSFIALSMIRCSKSADESAVQVCQVATVVMETTQIVLSQF